MHHPISSSSTDTTAAEHVAHRIIKGRPTHRSCTGAAHRKLTHHSSIFARAMVLLYVLFAVLHGLAIASPAVLDPRNSSPQLKCSGIKSAITRAHEQSKATSFCSSYLNIKTHTTTTTTTTTKTVPTSITVTSATTTTTAFTSTLTVTS